MKYKRIEKYVYQYYNKYVIKQKQQTLYITNTLEDALQKKQELLQQGKLRPLRRGRQRNPENRNITKTPAGTYAIWPPVRNSLNTGRCLPGSGKDSLRVVMMPAQGKNA